MLSSVQPDFSTKHTAKVRPYSTQHSISTKRQARVIAAVAAIIFLTRIYKEFLTRKTEKAERGKNLLKNLYWPVFCPSIEQSLLYSISWERELPKHTINHTTVLSHIRFLYLLLMLTSLSFLCIYVQKKDIIMYSVHIGSVPCKQVSRIVNSLFQFC